MMCRSKLWLCLLAMILAGCSAPTATPYPTPNPFGTCTPDWPAKTAAVQTAQAEETPAPPDSTILEAITPQVYFGYTHLRANGNRLVAGRGNLLEWTPLEIPLPGPASWVVAIPWGSGSLWAVTLSDGQVLGFTVDASGWQPTPITPNTLEAGQPPLLLGNGETFGLLTLPADQSSPITHPIVIPETHQTAFIDPQGNLDFVDSAGSPAGVLGVNALPDARILLDENGRLLLLADPTTDYAHGILGDEIEARSIVLIDSQPHPKISNRIAIVGDLVFEGLAPLWADLNGDGRSEIIVTASNATQGAQILVFDESGEQIAAGLAIGQGYRWRHQIAVAPFGPNGELELVEVLTPHLGGIVNFYQLRDDRLDVVAQLPGYTSHVIGTRNLDMAAAGDFDGDGQPEILLPSQDLQTLAGIHRTISGAEVAWSLPLSGRLTTNIGAVSLADGSLAMGVGLENDILSIWQAPLSGVP